MYRLCIIALVMVLSSVACSLSSPQPTSVPINTSVPGTPVVVVVTSTPTTGSVPPTQSSSQPTQQTLPTQSNTSGGTGGCVLNARFIADITIPDGTPMYAGQNATKTWRVRNNGTCNWTAGTQLVRISQANPLYDTGDTTFPIEYAVVPVNVGYDADLNVNIGLSMQSSPGQVYQASYRLRSGNGTYFGDTLFVKINSINPPSGCTNDAKFVADVTVPDGSAMYSGQTLTKTWRIRNSGTCNWASNSGYQWVRVNELNPLFDTANPTTPVYTMLPVNAGAEVDFSINIGLNAQAVPGQVYQASYRLRAPNGTYFGNTFFVQIVAVAPPTGCTNNAQYVADVTLPDGSKVYSNTALVKTWRIRNTGSCNWTTLYRLVRQSGGNTEIIDSITPPEYPIAALNANTEGDFSVTISLSTLAKSGLTYSANYRLRAADGTYFGPTFTVKLLSGGLPTVCTDNAQFVSDITLPDGSLLKAGVQTDKVWQIRNTGNCAWGTGYQLVRIDTDDMYVQDASPVYAVPPFNAGADGYVTATITLGTFSQPGHIYTAQYQLRSPGGTLFGPVLSIEIMAEP